MLRLMILIINMIVSSVVSPEGHFKIVVTDLVCMTRVSMTVIFQRYPLF